MLNLLDFVIPLAGKLICQLNPDSDDLDYTSHITEVHRQCMRTMHDDFVKLTSHGIATNELVLALLRGSGFSDEHIKAGMRILTKFGLLVPIFKGENTTSSGSSTGATATIIDGVEEYVVPAQLPSLSPDSHFAGEQWTKEPYKTCYIWFSTEGHLHDQPWLSLNEMRQAGFTSPGVFQRLVAMLVVYCQSATEKALALTSIRLFEDVVILKIAGQYFRIKYLKNENALRLDIVGERQAIIVN